MSNWNVYDTFNLCNYTHYPDGFSINLGLKNYKDGMVIREFYVGNTKGGSAKVLPGYRSYDGSYIEYEVYYDDISYQVQSTVAEGELMILVTALSIGVKAPVLFVEGGIMWNNTGYVYKENDQLVGHTENQIFHVFVEGNKVEEKNLGINSPYISVTLGGEIGITTGKKRGILEIKEYIATARKTLLENALKYADNSEGYLGMKCCLAWDTIYEPEHNEFCTPVSRIWNRNWGGYILYCWDTFFAAEMIALDNKELAYSNIYSILNKITEDGFVAQASAATGYITYDRSQPPVGSMTVLNIYNRYHEIEFVKKVFHQLLSWNKWFYENRMVEDGTLCWGSKPFTSVTGNEWEEKGVGTSRGGAYESGLDNSPMYDNISFDPKRYLMELSDVGLTGVYILDCSCLIQLGEIIGEEVNEIKMRMKRGEQGLEGLWCEESGIYCNKKLDTGEFSSVLSPTNFYAMFCDNIPKYRIERMLKEHLLNEEEFWGEYVLPSISKKEPSFQDQEYWRGRIWGPMNYLVYRALEHYQLDHVCRELAEKSYQLFMKEWEMHKHVHENYSAITGMGCDAKNSDKFYHWGGLLPYIKILEFEKEMK